MSYKNSPIFKERVFSLLTHILINKGYAIKAYSPTRTNAIIGTQNGDLKIWATIESNSPFIHLEGTLLDKSVKDPTLPVTIKFDLNKTDLESIVKVIVDSKPSTGLNILTHFFTLGVNTFGTGSVTIQDRGSTAFIEVNTNSSSDRGAVPFTMLTPTALDTEGTHINCRNETEHFASSHEIVAWLKFLAIEADK